MDLITTTAQTGYTPPGTSVVHNAQVSLTSRPPASIVHLVQYDVTIPIVAVALMANGQPYTVPSGAAVNVRLAKPGGTYVYNPALGVSEDGQTAYIAITVQMTAVAGKIAPVIEIVVDGNVASTGFFVLDIDPNPIPEDAIESTDEFKTIQQLAAEVTQAAKDVTDNLPAINAIGENIDNINAVAQNGANISAVGGSIANVNSVAENLTPIQTAATNISAIQQAPQQAANAAASATLSESWAVGGTGTREGENTNNAKYYAEQAQQVSQGAVGWYETEQALQAAHPTGQNGNWGIVGTTDTIWTWDSDTNAWVDTGSQIDMSQYYTKNEANSTFVASSGLLDLVYPVGSVYMSANNVSPQTFLGGTWQQIQEKFLLAASSSYPAGSTGGEAEHTLTKSELPNESLQIKLAISGDSGAEYAAIQGFSYVGSNPSTLVFGNTDPLGSGEPITNMPPYLAVYMWQRTA